MKFRQASVNLKDVPIGTPCISELDYDDGVENPVRIVPVERNRTHVKVFRFYPVKNTKDEVFLINTMRVCPKEDENGN